MGNPMSLVAWRAAEEKNHGPSDDYTRMPSSNAAAALSLSHGRIGSSVVYRKAINRARVQACQACVSTCDAKFRTTDVVGMTTSVDLNDSMAVARIRDEGLACPPAFMRWGPDVETWSDEMLAACSICARK